MTKRYIIYKIGRNSGTGRFISVEKAKKLTDKAEVETMKRPA